MNGAIIAHTPIAVDIWTRKAVCSCRLFFLSHAHTDHTSGLTSSWKHHKIYCSEVTKDIVIHKLGVSTELLVGIPVGETVTILMDEYGQEKLTVTLIDANHCPGAVMFLFEGYFGSVLYTGDFRYDKSMTEHSALNDKMIDRLYLDNTYCEPTCLFPSREEAMSKILDIVEKHLKKDINIVIGMSALGKEDLLVKIALNHQTWIGVDSKRLSLLKLLNLPNVFTCDVENTRVQVLMQKEITKESLKEWNTIHLTIAILPTALFEGSVNPYKYMPDIFVVPFSDHSSYEELVTFVSLIKPKEIIPIVLKHRNTKMEPNNTRTNMSILNPYLNEEHFIPIAIPDSVLKYMNYAKHSLGERQRSTSNYHVVKRKRCAGVVFPDDQPFDASSSPKCETQDLNEEPAGVKESILQNDSVSKKKKIKLGSDSEKEITNIMPANDNCHSTINAVTTVQTSSHRNVPMNLGSCPKNQHQKNMSNKVVSDNECHSTSTSNLSQGDPIVNCSCKKSEKIQSYPASFQHCSSDVKLNSDPKGNSANGPLPIKKQMLLMERDKSLDEKAQNDLGNTPKAGVVKDVCSCSRNQESLPRYSKHSKTLHDFWGHQRLHNKKALDRSEETQMNLGLGITKSGEHIIGPTIIGSFPKYEKPSQISNITSEEYKQNNIKALGKAAVTTFSSLKDYNYCHCIPRKEILMPLRNSNQCKLKHKAKARSPVKVDLTNIPCVVNSDDEDQESFCWFTANRNFSLKKK